MPVETKLEMNGNKLTEDGKEIILRGAVAPHFIWRYDSGNPLILPDFKIKAQTLRDWGANFIIMDWNSGFVDDPQYIEALVSALEYASTLGLRIELSLGSRGMKSQNWWENQQLIKVDSQLVADWANLLKDSRTASRIGRVVGIYGLLSEPVDNARGGRVSINDPLLDQACATIRTKIKKDNAICAYSGPDNGGNVRELIGTSPSKKDVAIEVHPYKWIDDKTDFEGYVNTLRAAGYLVFVGEMGCKDPPEFVREQVKFFKEHGISFSFWGMVAATECEVMYKSTGALTTNGQILREALR